MRRLRAYRPYTFAMGNIPSDYTPRPLRIILFNNSIWSTPRSIGSSLKQIGYEANYSDRDEDRAFFTARIYLKYI